MIKLPKEINKIIKVLEGAGGEAYVAGQCVRDSLLGEQPVDWDIYTSLPAEAVNTAFPEGKAAGEKNRIVRLDFTSQENEEGIIADITACVGGNIEAALRQQFFTVNAIADNPDKAMLDPFNGRADIKDRLIRVIGDPSERFAENPVYMLKAVRNAAELGFDLHMPVYQAIKDKCSLLGGISKAEIREELMGILATGNAGKGLRMLTGADLMPYILGESVASRMNKHEIETFDGLVENIDKTLRVPERRLGLLYLCFDTKRAVSAIEYLEHDGDLQQNLLDALYLSETMCFMATKHDLKEFLVHYGPQRYEYLHNLAKAQRIVYDLSEVKIMNRHYMMQDIINNGEPVYIEDLAIDANDIIEAGIAEADKAGRLLLLLTDVVHRKPKENTRADLLKYAAKFAKSKSAATFRKVKWLK